MWPDNTIASLSHSPSVCVSNSPRAVWYSSPWAASQTSSSRGATPTVPCCARRATRSESSMPNLQGASRSLRSEREDLIRIRIGRGPLHDVEAKVGGLMAAVARLGERVERRFEPPCVFLLDRCPQAFDRRRHHPRDGVPRCNRRFFMGGVVLDDVVEALAKFLDFVVCK